MGIDVDRAHRVAFGIGTAITAMAGGLVATYYPFQPYVGLEFVIIMYAGVVLGGMGSIIGAFWGGMMIGLVQQLSTLVLPTQLQNTAIFVVFRADRAVPATGSVRPQRDASLKWRACCLAQNSVSRVKRSVLLAVPLVGFGRLFVGPSQPVLPAAC